MWLIVSSLSSHNLHLLFCCVSSIIDLIWFVLMALFCAAIRRDSVYLLRLPLFRHVQVLLCEMLLISSLKHPQICFPCQLCFLVIVVLLVLGLPGLFLLAVITPFPHFSMYCSSRCIDTSTLSSMLVSPLPSFFSNTYSLSTSSMGCNAFFMVISFLFLFFFFSICLSSSLVHFKNG